MDDIRIAIIGSGLIAERHLYSFRLLHNLELMGINSRNEKKARVLMKKFKISNDKFLDYNALLKSDCDAVSVCLPNFMHKDITIDLLNSGKHVLIEKPLAMDSEEGNEMLDAAKSAKRTIFYCENTMYAPAFNKAKEIIDEDRLGIIYMARGKEQHSGPHSEWFYKRKKSGGGCLIDLGIHDIACLVWFLGCDVKKVFCQVRTALPDRGKFGRCDVEDNAVGVLYFENGAQVIIEESWTAPGGYDIRYELFGTEGQIKVSPTHSNLIKVYTEKGYNYAVEKAETTKGWTFPVPAESWTFGYPQEIKHFIDCMINKKEPRTDGSYGLKILKIVEAMYKSAETKKIEEITS